MRRLVLPFPLGRPLPLYVETVGTTIEANRIVRAEGYPHYHWLQTTAGEGRFSIGESTFPLPAGSGILVPPGIPHAYESAGGQWSTAYLTFGGPAVPDILLSLGLTEPEPIHWEHEVASPMNRIIEELMDRLEAEPDLFGLHASADAYRFLLVLRQYGRTGSRAAIIRGSEKLRPLLEWLDAHYADAEVGLEEMQRVLGMPVSTMNLLFRQTFGVSPYAYLIHLRLRKAKELLIGSPGLTVKMIAERVGFRDASHFVATFRRKTGLPPEQFRKLYE